MADLVQCFKGRDFCKDSLLSAYQQSFSVVFSCKGKLDILSMVDESEYNNFCYKFNLD